MASVLLAAAFGPMLGPASAAGGGGPYCSATVTLGNPPLPANPALPEQSSLLVSVTYCQQAGWVGTTWAGAYAYVGGFWSPQLGQQARFLDTTATPTGTNTTATLSFTINVGDPNVKLLAVFLRFGAAPDPTSYDLALNQTITVVGNPSGPALVELHLGGAWLNHPHPLWSWYSSALNGSITQYMVNSSVQADFTTVDAFFHPTLPASGIYRLRVRAMNNVGVWSAWSPNVTAKVDLNSPVTTRSVTPPTGNAGWYRGDAVFSLTATDGPQPASGLNGVFWSVDGETPDRPFVSNVTVHGDKIHHVRYYSTDLAGNQETPTEFQIPIDTFPPGTKVGLGGPLAPTGWYLGPVTAVAGCVDPGGDQASGCDFLEGAINNGTWTRGDTLLFNDDGAFQVTFRSTDIAGNVGANLSRDLRIDRTPPALTVDVRGENYTSHNGWWNDTVRVTIGCTDVTSGVPEGAVTYLLDAGPERVYNVSDPAQEPVKINADKLSDGIHNLVVKCHDAAGNHNDTSMTIADDRTAPRLILASAGYSTGEFNVTYNATDNLSGLAGNLEILEQASNLSTLLNWSDDLFTGNFSFPWLLSNFTPVLSIPVSGLRANANATLRRDPGIYCYAAIVHDAAGNSAVAPGNPCVVVYPPLPEVPRTAPTTPPLPGR